MQTKIFYLQGIIGEKVLLEDYARTIQKLINGEFQAADLDLKKVKGYRVYSVRVNLSDRLLFTKIELKGKNYFVLLEVIYNHDYQKSRFLKPNVLKHYMELNEERLAAQIDRDIEEINPSAEAFDFLQSKDSCRDYSFSPIEFYKEQYLIRSANQEDAVTQSFPLVIGGPAGSGKTLIAVTFIAQFIERGCPGNLVYVTESKDLLLSVQAIWQARPEAQGLCESKVQFKTYAELMQEYFDKNLGTVSQAHFVEWFSKTRYKTWDAKKVYQEMRIIAECASLTDYLQLGERQSLFIEERTILFDLCQQYKEYLSSNHFIDLSLALLEVKKHSFACILSDESQDMSHQQLKSLYHMAENGQICYFMDSHQSLFDNKSKRPFLLQLIYQEKAKNDSAYFELTCNFRCKPAIVKLSNQLICLKNNLTGGIADKFEYPEMEALQVAEGEEGKVIWLESFTPDNLEIFNQLKKSTAFAIVTSEKNKARIREQINTALVFTPEEIKGLEYDFVLVYRPFDEAVFQKANKSLKNNNALTQRKHRAKKGAAQDEYGPPFNKMLTGFTRAIHTLFIFQPKTNDLITLINFLQAAIDPPKSKLLTIAPELSTMSQQAWDKEREIQAAKGNREQAAKIFDVLKVEKSPVLPTKIPPQRKSGLSRPQKPNPVQRKSTQSIQPLPIDEEQRVRKPLEASFNQDNLKNLFLSPRAAEFLFSPNAGKGSLSIIAICKDLQKCQSFKAFIKKNGALAAKVLDPHLLLALKEPVKQANAGNAQLLSSMDLALSDFQRNQLAFLTDLLPHYSFLQKLVLYLDSFDRHLIRSTFDYAFKRCLTLENLKKNSHEVYKILMQPALDNPEISRLHMIAQPRAEARNNYFHLHDFFDNEGECMLPLTVKDLFEVEPNSQTSLFYLLTTTKNGNRFLSRLLKPEYALTKALTLKDLCCKPGLALRAASGDSALFNMGKYKSTALLKQLITAEMAEKLDHGLPDHPDFIMSLCGDKDGLDILELLLAKQDSLRSWMITGLLTDFSESSDLPSMFSQLAMTRQGIAILQQLLDLAGEDFAKALSVKSLFSDFMENCPWIALNQNREGRVFLQNLKAKGWQYPDNFPGEESAFILGILPFVDPESKISAAATCRFFYSTVSTVLKNQNDIEAEENRAAKP